jgi:hypothetical protein
LQYNIISVESRPTNSDERNRSGRTWKDARFAYRFSASLRKFTAKRFEVVQKVQVLDATRNRGNKPVEILAKVNV